MLTNGEPEPESWNLPILQELELRISSVTLRAVFEAVLREAPGHTAQCLEQWW